tara:strand:+ start:4498 stop:5511 length:1014 start_codon:yes stop_codon:yes gene_type:complete
MHIKNINLPKKILSWYDNNKRILPWRLNQKNQKHQYYRIISEFMLQQTQVKTVIPYFKKFVKKMPNLESLSKSKEKEILKLWEGLGYYRRARNLRKSAQILVKNYKSKIPNTFEEIKKLPGVGDYTANILLALIYNQPRIGLDGNVKRVLFRLFKKNADDLEILSKKITNDSYFHNRNNDFAEALMEFGAIICKPKNPSCDICIINKSCYSFKKKKIISTPKKRNIKLKKYNIYCYLKKKQKQIALTKNQNLSFLSNFNVPCIKIVEHKKNVKRNNKWTYLSSYEKNISNIKMKINLFYKFTHYKPLNFKWYSIDKPEDEFIPTFTKKIFREIIKLY